MECYTDGNIYLRLMTSTDTGDIIRWRNNEDVKKYFIYQGTFTKESHDHWIESMIDTGKVVQMIICHCNTDVPIGSVYLRDIDQNHHKAEYGIFIGETIERGQGIGTTAAKLMVKYGFYELGLHKIFLRVLADNVCAIRSYEKAGFIKEAYLRDDVYINGSYKDVVLMAVLREE